MIDASRIRYVKELVSEHKLDREHIEKNIANLNADVITPEVEELIKWYVVEKMEGDNLTFLDIKNLIYKIHKLKGQSVPDEM